MILAVGLAFVGYLLGSVPSADLVTKAATRGALDLRDSGDGNPGATNAIQTLGMRWGLIVLVADITKGAIASAIGDAAAGSWGAAVAGLAAICGHIWPIWTKGKGGKGVATSAGYCLAAFPAYFPIDLAVAIGSSVLGKSGATAIRVASVVWVVSAVAWWRLGLSNLWGPGADIWLPIGAVGGSVAIQLAFARAARSARTRRPSA